MPKSLIQQLSFSGGEWSPLLDARADLPKYTAACRQMQNMIATKQGGCTRRPGFIFKARTKLYDQPTVVERLMPFEFSPTTSFMLEFGNFYVRFYSNEEQVVLTDAPTWVSGTSYPPGSFVEDPTDADNIYYYANVGGGPPLNSIIAPHLDFNWTKQSIYEVPTPYQADSGYGAKIYGLVPCQINDIIYLCHPEFPVWKLTRYGDTDWRMEEVKFLSPSLLDLNATGIQITASATTGSVTLTASAPAWVTATYYQPGQSVNSSGILYTCLTGHVSGTFATDLMNGVWVRETIFDNPNIGGFFQVGHVRQASYVEVALTANGTSATLETTGEATLETFGTWAADVALQRSDDGGTTWQTIRMITSRSDHNANVAVEIVGTALFRIVVSNYSASTPTPRAVFTSVNSIVKGLVRITAVGGDYLANAVVVTQLYSTNATVLWAEGAWSARRGYPNAVTAFQQRMIYGGTIYEPQRIWGTRTNDIENFDLGDQSLATDGFAFDLAAVGRGIIQWLIGQVDLAVGFSGAEWFVNAGEGSFGGSNQPVTPQQINAGEHSSWGSCDGVPPALVGNAVIYAQRSAKTLQQMQFSVYTNKYMSAELTGIAEHMFGSGIVQIDHQPQFRDQEIIWVVTQAGSLCGMTYQQEQEVFAWHRHITGYDPENETLQKVMTVAVIDGEATEDDQVWVVVQRPGGRYVELMNPNIWEKGGTAVRGLVQPAPQLAIYVDSAITVVGPTTNVVGGLTHLAGQQVVALINGNNAIVEMTVSGSGEIEIPNYEPTVGNTDVLQIGLPIYYAIQPMRLDSDSRAGLIAMITKALSRVYLRVWNSLSGKVGDGTDRPAVPIPYRGAIGTGLELFTGQKDVQPWSTQSDDPVYVIEGHDPLPLTVLSSGVRIGIQGSP